MKMKFQTLLVMLLKKKKKKKREGEWYLMVQEDGSAPVE